MKTVHRIAPLLQAFYYLVTAVWPFVHLQSFLYVTGPKTDIWLVKTVSLLLVPYAVLLIDAALLSCQVRRIFSLAMSICCASLAGIDLYYYLSGTISAVYLADFGAEIIFMLYWLVRLYKSP
ncbi:MAG: hypothetical protein EAS48_01130 [Chryseobacterium sp.]|nr:MAG: hypothetical protein EAS48_01130 [Chryseobacterium sp.]